MKAHLPQGFGGGPSNMQGVIKQAQKMQERMAELQAELDEREYDFTVGGGMITIKMNGKKEMQSRHGPGNLIRTLLKAVM